MINRDELKAYMRRFTSTAPARAAREPEIVLFLTHV